MQFKVINILDAVEHMPDEALMQLLGSFSCIKNKQMEHFLHANAVSCAKQRFAITYLVLNQNNELCGFFTLTHKPVFFDKERIDGKRKRRVRQFCVRSLSGEQQENDEQLLASAFLIAQLAKSSSELTGEKATGGELMSFALQTLAEIQKSIGGGLVFLECEDEEKLLAFYERQGFCKFGERDSRSYDGQFYHQLLRVL